MIFKFLAILLWGSVVSSALFTIKYLPQLPIWGYLIIPIVGLHVAIAWLGFEVWENY